ncbi:Gamma-aminobutyric acid type B receptor subunit 2 [Halotydeus destructor]|nr:Gamma-aminobutyric acid type B receptor subunit 2 [Halotydeus destructor]
MKWATLGMVQWIVTSLLAHPGGHLVGAKRMTLYAAGFFPVSESIPEGAIGRGVIPAVELALQHINDSPKVLRGIHLDLVWNDTECNAALGMKTLFDMLYAPPPKVMLFGDACNSVTDPIAKASRFFHLIQLSYADTHPMYTLESYPNFFRVVPSEAAFNPARVALFKYFNWTRVGTIYQNSPRYSLPHSKLLTDLDTEGIEIAYTQSISEEVGIELHQLKENDVRIIVGNFDETWAVRIFCQAYKQGIYGRRYQWILGAYDDRWWEKIALDTSNSVSDCTIGQLHEALDGYISIDVLPLSSSREITVSGMTAYEYEAAYNGQRKEEYSKYHGYAYDGVWTIAYAIHSVNSKLRAQNSPLSFKDFKYRDPLWAQFFREALSETSFTGVTGKVSFDGNERRGSILLKQFQGGEEVQIGEYHCVTDTLNFNGADIYWRGGNSPPVDRTFQRILPSRISLTLFMVITVLAVLGIILACVFLAMNIKYRNQKYIKMSSPYLNNLIIIGCILTYTSVILLGLDSGLTSETNFPYICTARAWVLMSGFTIAFGSMFSKTWRVHAIFTNIKLNKKVIKDYKLFLVVAVLVSIDVATLTTWQIIDPFYRETTLGSPVASSQNEDILIVPELEFCQSKRMTIFLGSIYVYKGLLMAFGIFLAWETRHVSIPALNDSKYIGMSTYNVVIMCTIGVGLSFVLRDQQDAAFVIISIFIIFCSTTTLCLVFLPKLIELKRNPDAGDRRVRATLKPFKSSKKDSDEMELHARIKVVNDENCRQRQRLKEKTYELEALMFRLRSLSGPEKKPLLEPSSKSSATGGQLCPETGAKGGQSPQKQMSVVLAEKEARDSGNTTSIISLSASPSCPSHSGPGKGAGSPDIGHHGEPSTTTASGNSNVQSERCPPSVSIVVANSRPSSRPEKRPEVEEAPDDDTSYAKAIKCSASRLENAGSSSYEEDDTDRCTEAAPSEAESEASSRLSSSRPRARSEGTLGHRQLALSQPPSCHAGPKGQPNQLGANQYHLQLGRKYSYLNQSDHCKSVSGDEIAALQNLYVFSSYPLIKCDIVEYL